MNAYGIYHTLLDLKRYNKPVFITENGVADYQDQHRRWLIEQTLINVKNAMDKGLDVKGYIHWSLLDNFEWDRGTWPRFGLIAVDYKTQERTIKDSARYYAEVIAKNGV